MHPSNNLLLPILRKHGDRLLKAQIEAMVKELSWEEQEFFLRRQLDASVEAIRDKLATSYPDYPFLTEWQPEILKKSLKAWLFALSGEQNYLVGIDDFTLTISLIELGKTNHLYGLSPVAQSVTQINFNNSLVTHNGYKVHILNGFIKKKVFRYSGNELKDYICFYRGQTEQNPSDSAHNLIYQILVRF